MSRHGDDDDQDYRERRSSNKTVLVVLGIGAVVICVGLVICGGLVFFGFRALSQGMSSFTTLVNEIQAAQAVADTFLRDLGAGRVDEAYANTTKDFQARQSLAAFRDYVSKYPALKNYQSQALTINNPSATLATFQGTASGPNGQVSFTVQVIKDGQTWKVDRFTIP
jgi:hypothetical protein